MLASNSLSELHIPDSSAALATTTLLLQSVLENYVKRGIGSAMGDVVVTAFPPDKITTGGDERSQLNLFLYRVSPNVSLRAKANSGNFEAHLVVELSYLLTAYGSIELHAEVLLGRALWILNKLGVGKMLSTFTENLISEEPEIVAPSVNQSSTKPTIPAKPKPMLTSETLPTALIKSVSNESLQDAIIKTQFMGFEDMSKLWSSLQCKYRPSFTFLVAPVQL